MERGPKRCPFVSLPKEVPEEPLKMLGLLKAKMDTHMVGSSNLQQKRAHAGEEQRLKELGQPYDNQGCS